MSEVLPATENDLKVILGWLEREYEEDEEGFWSNRCMITRSFREDRDLWMIRKDGEAVAFQVGVYGTDIACVRKDARGQGYGTALANFSLARAFEDNVNVLCLECCPRSSLPFWEKMGFERYGDFSPWDRITVRRVLHRKHDIPTDLPKVEVTVSFYPEAVLYSSGVSPFQVCRLTGGLLENGRVKLPCRVIGLTQDAEPHDLVVKIEVNGDMWCFCKAKYDEAEAVGVQRGRDSHSYYIDEIVTAT